MNVQWTAEDVLKTALKRFAALSAAARKDILLTDSTVMVRQYIIIPSFTVYI